ncbi:MAG TPA: WhiB family transcriptional regulator [Candidatus Saccharimonadales bacterium]|nr:WhiB family transcriptional regulator [Candidatus Saccharimonadales bacterium]
MTEKYPISPRNDLDDGPLSWLQDAACAETSDTKTASAKSPESKTPDLFYPDRGGSASLAKKVCSICSVRPQCLDFALANDEKFGVWGGLSERERRKMVRHKPDTPTMQDSSTE